MKFNLHSLTKEFILNEGKGPTINSWIQALAENIGALKPRQLIRGKTSGSYEASIA